MGSQIYEKKKLSAQLVDLLQFDRVPRTSSREAQVQYAETGDRMLVFPVASEGVNVCESQCSIDEGSDSVSLTVGIANGATKRLVCDGNSNIVPNDCPDCNLCRE